MSDEPRAGRYALAGATLALGAPLGLLALRALQAGRLSRSWLRDEVSADPWTYAYVTASTLVVFTLFGLALGRKAGRLYHLSSSDPLTQLRNRRAMEERLHEELARSARYGSPLSVILLDLDGLKQLNDLHGHRRGDESLARVAEAIRSGSRATDLAARWGGDEFAILAPNTAADEAWRLAERIRALVAEGGSIADAVTVSAGVATLDPSRRVAASDDLIRSADAALYEAKRGGRNRVVAA